MAPRSDIAGQSESDTTASRAAAAAGPASPPLAWPPISIARARQAATDQRAAGTAVEPRTKKTPQAVTTAARTAAPQAAECMEMGESGGMPQAYQVRSRVG